MKEKRDCKIVQDLLPNYIEKLTNEETNAFIEKHLNNCDDCKKILENMKKDLNVNMTSKDKKAVKYFKKYKSKLKILKIAMVIILVIALGTMTYYYFTFKNAYLKSANILTEMVLDGIYPDAFYATIEEISEGEVYGTKTMKVKGLDINGVNYRGEFYFTVILDNIPDNFKIEFNGTEIAFEELKVGQKVAVYNYGDVLESEPAYLNQVRKIVVLDDTL